MSKIAVMCGHGRSTDGSWDCGTAYGGNNEAALMLPITKAAVKYLRSYGVEVISDADTNNNKNMIADVSWANKEKVSLYVSIHCDYYKAPSGVIPLYVSAKGKALATALNNAIKNGMPMKSRGIVRRTDLYELNYTDMPACILETGSIKADISILKQSDKYGKLIAKGICDYLGIKAETSTDSKLKVDGDGGVSTVKRMQEFFGTNQIDGVITGQTEANAKFRKALTSVKNGTGGSACVKAMQRWLSLKQDGDWGKDTSSALQKKLQAEKYYTGEIDGYFGPSSMKAFQKYLNEHNKAVYPDPVPEKTKPEKAVEYGKKIAADNSFHYVVWKSGDEKTKQCPICHKFPNGKYKGFNCIRYTFSCWYHADIPCKHEGGLINNAIGDRMYSASEAQMLRLAQDAIGCKDIKVIRNKNGFSDSQLQIGDACMHFEKGVYKHIYLYAGNGMMVDAGNWSDVNKQIAVRKRQSCQIIIRYTGK